MPTTPSPPPPNPAPQRRDDARSTIERIWEIIEESQRRSAEREAKDE